MVAALSSPQALTTEQLEEYYWDCDALFMKGELSGQDLLPCIAITDELKLRHWQGDHSEFVQWWRKHRHKQWQQRGYTHRPQ